MRIAILVDEYVPGAMPVLATQEARYLREEGFHVDILVGTKFSDRQRKECLKDESIIFLLDRYPRLIRALRFRFPFFSFFSPQHLLSALFAPLVIKSGDYDLVIAHGLFSAFIAYNLRRARKIPFFTLFWDPSSYILPKVYSNTILRYFFWILIPLVRRLDVWIAKSTNRLLLGSKLHLAWFCRQGAKDIQVVYPGCFAAGNLPAERGDFILAADRWDIGSLPDIFLEMLKNSRQKFQLKIAGCWHNAIFKKRFLGEVTKLGLEDYVQILGPLPSQELRQLFLSARCFIHPTLEAFGMSAFEAASSGCPFIIPAKSGVTDLFTHGKDGFFPAAGDRQEYAKYLMRLVEDKTLAYTMGYSAWETAKKYTWSRHAQEIAAIIKDFFKQCKTT